MIVATILTNGRIELLDQTIASFNAKLRGGAVTRRLLWDDSGNDEVHHYLRMAYGPEGWTVGRSPEGPEGFGGAMRSAWRWLSAGTDEPYVFWCEDDFTFEKNLMLDAMVSVLATHPHLAQLALRRQPWNASEKAVGGVVEMNPSMYTEITEGSATWLEHRLFWTTNPSLFRRELLEGGWADDPESEGRYTHRLLAEGLPWGVSGDAMRFAYWGSIRSAPSITHIGLERVGFGY